MTSNVAMRSVERLLAALATTALALSSLARAQSDIPERRQGTFRVTYQNLHLGDELLSNGHSADEGRTEFNALVVGADYGLTTRVALAGSATYVQSKYDGPMPHGAYDDGNTHGTLQDASLVVLYKARPAPFSIVPFAGVVVPMRDYETRGFAAAGRGLTQRILGVDFGWASNALPVEVHVAYDYRFVNELDGVNTDRRDVGLRIGYRFNSRLSGSLHGSRRSSPGGYDLITDSSQTNFMAIHDAASALTETSAGAGLTWTVNPQLDLYGTYSSTLSGENLQGTRNIAAGVAWHFGGNQRLGR